MFPHLGVASFGANRTDNPYGALSARVRIDGTNGISVNRRTRLRDQDHGRTAADLEHAMREKSKQGCRTFALTADVAESHRQKHIDERDWHLMGCQPSWSAPYSWSLRVGAVGSVHHRHHGRDIVHGHGRRLSYRSHRTCLQSSTDLVHCLVRFSKCPAVVLDGVGYVDVGRLRTSAPIVLLRRGSWGGPTAPPQPAT